jgi:sugar phosphate isomerase/epimerase
MPDQAIHAIHSAPGKIGETVDRITRRDMIKLSAAGVAAFCAPRIHAAGLEEDEPLFRISLAEWSLHRTIFSGELDHLDFPRITRERFELDAVEYVNAFFKDKARDEAYLAEMNMRCADHGVKSLLIMVDGEGAIGHPEEAERKKTVENHREWLEAAKTLGCHSIRVNAESEGTWDEQMERAADGLRRLTEIAAPMELNVIVENHGGLSSNGEWLAGVMKLVDHPRCGTLPDFGNFCMDWSRRDDPEAWYDRYKGVAEMMPWAKAVSAKSHEFNDAGDEVHTDYRRMMKIVLDHGYRGYVGIEWEGDGMSEEEGILATKRLLERVREEFS